ncbi:MAG: DNA polymerase III subunit alpha, partial [Parvibaculales bacterium]
VSLEQAIDREPRLQQARKEEEGVERLLEIALKLEGLYRHASTHAAGVVIGDRPLEELVALYRDPKSDMALTQFNMKWVEKAGLVKFDFLGLKTLTVIEKTVSLLKEQGIRIDIDTISLSDEKTFTMLAEGDTVGVFQLEGAGMREAMVKMRPDCFGDIIALVALYRPGPMENIPRYNHCKHGTEKPDYLHPMLKPILEETYGVIIYQEQVMEIARTLSNFSLGEADMLRRAMGKKIQEEMDAQKKRFIEGAVKNGVDERKASIIFDQVDRFAGYGFNKSHAAAYALIAYHTAWLKANHPVAFLAASLSLDFERTDKIQTFCQQARKAAIKILPPNVNKSDVMFSVEGNAVRYALAAVRNVGREMMEALVRERKENGPFKDIFTMMERVGSTNINKRSLEYLAKSGAFDEIHENRAQIIEHIPKLMEIAQLAQHDRDTKQDSLFIGNEEQIAVKELPMKESFSSMEKLSHEFEAIGFYLSAHPIEAYRKQLKRVHVISYAELMEGVQAEGLVAGAILSVSERRSKQGNRFAFVTLSDETGQFEAVIFSDILEKIRPLLVEGELVVMGVHIARGEEEARIRCNGLHGLSKIIENAQAGMRILLEKKETLPLIAERLPKGKGSVELVLLGKTHEVEMKLEGGYLVDPEIISKIKSLPGVLQVEDF